jgi:hypothetical protein
MTPEELQAKHMNGDFKLKGEFAGSDYSREETLTRCERYAGWTLPGVFPDDPLLEYDELQNDFQSVGAQATINLANRIMMVLFQPSRPFFRMKLTDEQRENLRGDGRTDAEIDAALAKAEREAVGQLTNRNARIKLTEAITSLIITGNALLYTPEDTDKHYQTYTLRDYVLVRDLVGRVVKIITRETKSVRGLSDELQAVVLQQGFHEDDEVTIYTGVQRVGENKYVAWQELEDVCYCSKGIGIYNQDTLPWIPLVWNLARNKDYGTGLVENYSGDFHTLSTLAEAILDYTVMVTDIKHLVDPTGSTDVRELTEAPSGAYVHGREGDIFTLQAQVSNNADFLREQMLHVERRIAAAFLLNTAVTRDAERVTAEEIRLQAQELENSLGGVYSRLAVELQKPLAIRVLSELSPVFKGVEPVIVTGLESLSRSSDLDRIRLFFADLVALAEVPEEVRIRIDYDELIAMLGAGHGIDYKKFLKTPEQVKESTAESVRLNATAAGMEEQARSVGQQAGTPT